MRGCGTLMCSSGTRRRCTGLLQFRADSTRHYGSRQPWNPVSCCIADELSKIGEGFSTAWALPDVIAMNQLIAV